MPNNSNNTMTAAFTQRKGIILAISKQLLPVCDNK